MSTTTPIEVKYARITQKQGNVENMPVLASAEFGFSYDSSQLFIGSDPELSTSTEYHAVAISPFVNAKEVVQGYLDASTDYSTLKVDSDLVVRCGNTLTATGVMNYINNKHNESVTDGRKAIAYIDSNIEIVTNKNIHQFSEPAEKVIRYSSNEQLNVFQNHSYYRILNDVDGNIFTEFPINGVLGVDIEYMLIQNDGSHVRKGHMSIIADSTGAGAAIVNFKDDKQVLEGMATALSEADSISFDVEPHEDHIKLKFTQPDAHQTKIFYKIKRWHIDDYVNINNYTTSGYIGPLGN